MKTLEKLVEKLRCIPLISRFYVSFCTELPQGVQKACFYRTV